MRKILITISIILSGLVLKAQYHQGIGIALGAPSGFSYKIFTNESTALDFTLGWTPRILVISGLYELHAPLADELTWYYGAGAHLGVSNNYPGYNDGTLFLGADGVIGIEFKPDIPVAFSIDFRPQLDILGRFGLTPLAQLGIRYVLK